MRKIATMLLLLSALSLRGQPLSEIDYADRQQPAYQVGEFLHYRIHYGFLNAGYANLSLGEDSIGGSAYIHAVGYGYSTGLVRLFFKVKDYYDTYIDPHTALPRRFIRNIDEGGYTKHVVIDFDQQGRKAFVRDVKKNTTQSFSLQTEVQDMLSAFYFLRNIKPDRLVDGSQVKLNVFLDKQSFPFRLSVLGSDWIKTKFGRIRCLKIRPSVQDGRIFKDQEGVTVWVSQDQNHIPIRIEARLAVGSLSADLRAYKKLRHPIRFLPENPH